MSRLHPLQRAYLLGFRRAQALAREQFRAAAHEWEAELASCRPISPISRSSIVNNWTLGRLSSSVRRAQTCYCTEPMRLHGTERWRRLARHQLRAQPLCEMCLREGRVTAATCADHVTPHHGDVNSFWTGKLQSLCDHCHNSRKKDLERLGYDRTVGVDGLPLDPRHPIYRT